MKGQYVRDLVDGVRVDSVFAVRSRDIRSARTGDPYLSLEIADSTGSMPAVMFRPSISDESVPTGAVVKLRGSVTTYRGVRRVQIESLCPEASYTPEDLLPRGIREVDEMMGELRAHVRKVREPRLRAILKAVFGDPGFIGRFAACPAGQSRHHAYIGGLLEHTLAVAGLSDGLAAAYPAIDRDLLLTAALLHDVGKVDELEFDTAVGCTEAGRLVGHVVLGERRVSRAIERLGEAVPSEMALRLSHAVLAHHGEMEWGAARQPCSLEALVLHLADNLDAQVAAFMDTASGAAVLGERWTDTANQFGRALLVPDAPAAPAARVCA